MNLQLNEQREGSQAIVFFDRQKNRVYKVFKSFKHPSNSDQRDLKEVEFNEWKRNIYNSEKTAYDKIAKSNVKEFFPVCYNDVTIEKIDNENGLDISDCFLLDCVLTLDLVSGDCDKQSLMREECKNKGVDLQDIFNELKKIGVNFFIDSSVFCDDEGIKIIDIATNDFEDFQPQLNIDFDFKY